MSLTTKYCLSADRLWSKNNMDRKDTAQRLRKLAKTLREKDKETSKEKTTKCAQVLVAAQGLHLFEEVLRGESS